MSQQAPNVLVRIVGPNGEPTQVFSDYLVSLGQDTVFTLSTLPRPLVGLRIFVSDATGGGCPCYGDGTNFRRYSNDAIVS